MRKTVIYLAIVIIIISCSTKKLIAIETTSNIDSVITKQKISTPELEYLSDLNFQKDTIFFQHNKFRDKKMFFIDSPRKNGFIREYHSGNKVINNLIVENNKIVRGLYVNAVLKANIVKRIFDLYEYENGKKEGVYISFGMGTPMVLGMYHMGVKVELMGLVTSGKQTGTFFKHVFKNGKTIKSSDDYLDWNKEKSKFLNKKEAESVKNFISSLHWSII